MSSPKIGIVTVLYNSGTVLDGFYESLTCQTYKNFVVYAIDNHSPDDSLAKVTALAETAWFETVVIPEEDNWGVAKGNNIGIRRALADGCDLVLLANNDVEFGADVIGGLCQSMTENHADMIVPKILYYGTDKIWCAGGGYGYRKPTYHIGMLKPDSPKYNKPRRIDYSPTCFMLVHRKVFDTVGMMDEAYFAYFDDTDFVWRAVKQHGCTLFYEPRYVVQHKVGMSSRGKLRKFAFYLDHRNSAYFMNKYYPWYRRWMIYTYRLGLHLLTTLRHPEYPKIPEVIGYYKEGVKMYHQSLVNSE